MDHLIAFSLGTLIGLVFGSLLHRKPEQKPCCQVEEEKVTEIPAQREAMRPRTMFDNYHKESNN